MSLRPLYLVIAATAVVSLGAGATACATDDTGPEEGQVETEIGEAASTVVTTTTTAPTGDGDARPDGEASADGDNSLDEDANEAPEPGGPVGAADPAAAATALYEAFDVDDRDTASEVAEPEAVEETFAAERGPYALYSDCDSGEFDVSGCLFRDRTTNNTIQFDMERRGDAWVVTNAFFSPG